MAAFIALRRAHRTTANGDEAANLAEAKKLLRRRGIRALRPSALETPRTAKLTGPTRQVSNRSTSTACLRKRRA